MTAKARSCRPVEISVNNRRIPDARISRMRDEIVIEAGRSERHYWRDLWRYRELFRVLAWRDLSVRYKQTVIGVLWALIRPFLTMVVYHHFRPHRQAADGRQCALRADGVCRHFAVDFLFHRPERGFQ